MQGLLSIALGFGLLGAPEDHLQRNLNIHIDTWIRTKEIRGAKDFVKAAEVEAANDIANVFFTSDLMLDRARVETLANLLVDRIQNDTQGLRPEAFEALLVAINEGLARLEKKNTYIKNGWREAGTVSAILPLSLHVLDKLMGWFFKYKPAREVFSYPHRHWGESKRECRLAFVDLARIGRKAAKFSNDHPRWLLYGLIGPATFLISYRGFFGHFENWDAVEEVLRSKVIPVLQEKSRM